MSSSTATKEDINQLEREILQIRKESEQIRRETDQIRKESEQIRKESDQIRKESDQIRRETDLLKKESEESFTRLSRLFESQWGKLMESLVEGDLVHILRERGIGVNETLTRYKGQEDGEHFEFDIIAIDDDEIVIVEVKTTLRVKHIKKFLYRLDQVKRWIPLFRNCKIHGAVAFLRAEEESDVFAENKHLWVIRATGDSAHIANAPDFVPRTW